MKLENEDINIIEIIKTDIAIGFFTKYFRPPWGEYDQRLLNLVSKMGKISIGWVSPIADEDSFIPMDGIILLHPINKLDKVISLTLASGGKFVSLDDCLTGQL